MFMWLLKSAKKGVPVPTAPLTPEQLAQFTGYTTAPKQTGKLQWQVGLLIAVPIRSNRLLSGLLFECLHLWQHRTAKAAPHAKRAKRANWQADVPAVHGEQGSISFGESAESAAAAAAAAQKAMQEQELAELVSLGFEEGAAKVQCQKPRTQTSQCTLQVGSLRNWCR